MATNYEGPFSQYLQEQLQQPQQQPRLTGYEGGLANIANVASQFLQGIKQGRLERFAKQQEEEQKNLGRLEAAAKLIESHPDLTPQAKAQYTSEIYKQILGQAAAVPESNKQTGHHLTDAFKQGFLGMVGGQLPKEKTFNMSVIGSALDALSSPEYSISHNLSNIDTQMNQRLQQLQEAAGPGGYVTQQQLVSDKDFMSLYNKGKSLKADWSPTSAMIISKLPEDESAARLKQAELQEIAKRFPTTTAPVVKTQEAVTYPTELPGAIGAGLRAANEYVAKTSPVPSQVAQKPEEPKVHTLTSISQDNAEAAKDIETAKFFKIPGASGGTPHTIEKSDQLLYDPNKKALFQGVMVRSSVPGASGLYDASTGMRVENAHVPTEIEKAALSIDPEAVASFTKSLQAQARNLFKDDPRLADSFLDAIQADSLNKKDPLAALTATSNRMIQLYSARENASASRGLRNAIQDQNKARDIERAYDSYRNSEAKKDADTAEIQYISSRNALQQAEDKANKNSKNYVPGSVPDYGQADVVLVKSFFKMSHPQQAVRIQESNAMKQASGFAQKYSTILNAIANNTGDTLSPIVRAELYTQITALKDEYKRREREEARVAVNKARLSGGQAGEDWMKGVVNESLMSTQAPPETTQPPPNANPTWQGATSSRFGNKSLGGPKPKSKSGLSSF